MEGSSFLTQLAVGALVVGVVAILAARPRAPGGWKATALAVLHPLLFLGLFYSLAFHMHRALGGWPRVIGMRDFPEDLVLHAEFAQHAFGSLLLGTFVALPIGLLLCALVPRLRPGLRILGVYGVTSGAALVAMALAPGPFLSWWWD